MTQLPYNQVGERYEVTIESIDPAGKAIGWYQDKQVMCKGALPGEKIIFEVVKHKKGYLIGDLVEIIEPSSHRISPLEDHYLMCSPWQIMDYKYQCELKENFLRESFRDLVNEVDNFYPSSDFLGYRTKMEYGFVSKDGELSFSVRGHNSKVPTDNCVLASEAMNKVSCYVLKALRQRGVLPDELKSLVIRESKSNQAILVVLYTKNKKEINLTLAELPSVTGLVIAYSDPDRLISVATEILYKEGNDFLTEEISGLNISYPFNAFFQNNIPLFKQAVLDIKNKVRASNKGVEYYSGVGAIGLALHDVTKHMEAYEIISSMVDTANKNAEQNNISNYKAYQLSAEQSTSDILLNLDLLILDPPRKGLDIKLIKDILISKPKQIAYLACNHVSQARDCKLLFENYKISSLSGYDFYPNTPHVESLVMLELRK